MDLYLSDSNFLQQDPIEDYETLIWTDRYDVPGEFELHVPWSENLAANLRTRKYLRQSESKSIMMIETSFLERPSQNRKQNLVKLSGRSFEAFFENRNSASSSTDGRMPDPRTGSRAAIACALVNDYAVNNTAIIDRIPGLTIAPDPPAGTSVALEVARGPLDQMVHDVLSPDRLGWRVQSIYINGTQQPGTIQFAVYKGIDYTIPGLNAVSLEFSPDLENLTDISTLESIATYKNHARMVGAKTGINVYLPNAPSTVTGLERRTVVVEALDIGADSTTTVAEDQIALTARGVEVLLSPENRYQQLVDGDALTADSTTFMAAGLGDILYVRDSNGIKSKVRISEKIWTADEAGQKRLPTFEAVE